MFGEVSTSCRVVLTLLTLGAVSAGCQPTQPAASATATAPETPAACSARQSRFVEFLRALPERAVAKTVQVSLPVAIIGAAPGVGPVLEIAQDRAALDGQALAGVTPAERIADLKKRLEAHSAERPAAPIYVAVAPELEINALRSYLVVVPAALELRLLVRTDPAQPAPAAKAEALTLAGQLLAEQDPARRTELAVQAYAKFADCAEFDRAVTSTAAASGEAAWPARRQAMLAAAPSCRCSELDTESLQQIASAERRAGAAGLGYLPASFLRDERCGASMPRRAIKKLVQQIEAFDAEFSGAFQKDALTFEEVLTNDRLLTYFCNALPGETLAAQQRARATLYWRFPGTSTCQAWRFEPLSPGAPMGTWRRVPAPGAPPLAFHYWQAAEEIKLFGPVPDGSASKPTDERDWECKQNYRLTAVDTRSIQTDTGHWFLDEASCRAAPEEPSASTCVSTLATAP